MSSKKAIYESSILCGFGADDELADSGITMVGAAGWVAVAVTETDGFGFAFGAAVSLLTLTDAGTCAHIGNMLKSRCIMIKVQMCKNSTNSIL